MMIRMLAYDPGAETYEFMTRREDGRLVSHGITADDFSAAIQEEPDAVLAGRLRSLRRLSHRFPWSWVPMTAADGRREVAA